MTGLSLLMQILVVVSVASSFLQAAQPLVTSSGSVRTPLATVPATFRVVTYNLHGPPENRMNDLIELFVHNSDLKDALILGLQEVNRDHRKTGYRDVAGELTNALGTYYAFAVENPYERGGGDRGLTILSFFPMSQVERIALPHAGPGGRRRIALGSTLHLGSNRLRVYCIQLETRVVNRKHADQLTTVLKDAERYKDLPIVILGDFNIVYFRRKQTFTLMENSGYQVRSYDGISFRRAWLARKKLDWIWTKNLNYLKVGVKEKITISDHRPVWAQLAFLSATIDGEIDDNSSLKREGRRFPVGIYKTTLLEN